MPGQKLLSIVAERLPSGNAGEDMSHCAKSALAQPNRSRLYQLALFLSNPSCMYSCASFVLSSVHNISLPRKEQCCEASRGPIGG
jgi:hypothetical protein